jgi:hypothetical protein
MCRILIERGANPLRKNQAGRRASSYAGTYPNSAAYKYLLEMEAFCHSTDSVPDLKDGPYFFWESDDRIVMTYFEREQDIKRTRLREKTIEIITADTLIKGFSGDQNTYHVRQDMSPDPGEVVTAGKIFAIGDVHGRYNALVNLLKNNGIIDPELKWIFGDGQLVMLGDVFDRGSQVTETLWFLYHLQIQAREAGGNVHLLLGNHEIMAMTGDQRYLNDKYAFFARFTQSRYAWLYEKNTLLGQWLRSQNLILRINGNLFLHAGIAPQFAIHNLSLDEINTRVRAYLHSDYKLPKGSTDYLILGPVGPQWYRGYSEQSDKFPELTQEFVDSYLETNNLNRMILGHNEQPQITASFSGKVISCDVAIDESGASAQGLLISGEEVFKCYADGKRERME